MLHRRLRRLLPALVLPALLATAVPAGATRPRAAVGPADASGLTIQAFIWECQLYGAGVPADQAVTSVTLKRRNGGKVAIDDVQTSEGFWQARTVCDNKGKGAVLPGDRIKVTLTDTSSKTFTVPDLLPYGDPGKQTIGGPIPAGPGTLRVVVQPCDGAAVLGLCDREYPQAWPSPIYTQGSGSWRWKAPRFPVDGDLNVMRGPLTGLDLITVDWTTADGFYRVIQHDSSFLARVGSPKVTGYGRLGKPVTVTLRSAKGVVRATGTTTVNGFQGAWSVVLKKNGRPVAPRVGDVVSASIVSKVSVKLRKLALRINPVMPNLDGSCWPIQFWSVGTTYSDTQGSTTERDGDFSVRFLTLPAAGTKLTIRCAAAPGAIQTGTWVMPAQ